jgi:KDO2-lipid IV(A) lauroyltransferase
MLLALARALAPLPLAGLHLLGAAMGWVVYWASPTYRRRLQENLRLSGVCPDEDSLRRTRRVVAAELGKAVMELPVVWMRPAPAVDRMIACDDWPVMEAARARGKGILIITPHLGCFEAVLVYTAQRFPITALYRPPHARSLEPLMVAGRARGLATVAPASVAGVRQLLKTLKRGDVVGMLPDQAPQAGEGTWAPFFGRPAYTMTLARRLHEATGAAVVYTYARRLPGGRGYRLYFRSAPDEPFTEAAMNRAVEGMIRECPEQYLWSYNRYKVPAGVEPPAR